MRYAWLTRFTSTHAELANQGVYATFVKVQGPDCKAVAEQGCQLLMLAGLAHSPMADSIF